MPILNLSIGKSKYAVDCAEGEEDKIISLAAKLNERVNHLSLAARNADEKTILMLCALTIEEELDSAKNDGSLIKKPAAKKDPEPSNEPQISEEDLDNVVAAQIENTAEYIKNLVSKVSGL